MCACISDVQALVTLLGNTGLMGSGRFAMPKCASALWREVSSVLCWSVLLEGGRTSCLQDPN